MNFIKGFINKEISYFQKLHTDGQKLISAIMLFNLISPIFVIFINSFLWRKSHDLTLVAFFNLVLLAFIPVGFYLNGILLKKFSASLLHSLSLGINGIAVAIVIFLPNTTYLTVSLFGIINGIFGGIYWANRNLLTLKTTESDNRIYFTSIESSSGMITNVFIPLIIGWFIAFGAVVNFYTPVQAYQIVAICMLIIIGFIAIVAKSISINAKVDNLLIKNPNTAWKKYQALKFFYGLNNGLIMFVPTLMILVIVGNEDAVGTIQSFSSIITSLFVYILAKYLYIKHRLILVAASVTLLIIGGSIFGIFYSSLAVTIFFACYALSQPLIWIATSSLSYDLIDKENEQHHYAYVCDQEIYLNAGRVVAILFFIGAIYFGSNELALRFTPLLVAILQIFVLFLANSTEKHHQTKNVTLNFEPLNKEG